MGQSIPFRASASYPDHMQLPNEILAAWTWPQVPHLAPADSGLINQSWIVHGKDAPMGVLQWLNTRIFSPKVHEDIDAVTRHLQKKEVPTPRLIPTLSGEIFHTDAEGGVWRCLSWIGDQTFHKVTEPRLAESAGAAVAKFHSALADFSWEFRSVRGRFHDTPKHLAALSSALEKHPDHRLYSRVSLLAETLFAECSRLPHTTSLPTRVVHGDLKISNIRFQSNEALALIDLDTLAWGTLDAEMGDAFRSWCNPASEDEASPKFSLEIFEAGVVGYLHGAKQCGFGILPQEIHSFLPGTLRICLELAARFAADALEESYFGFNARYGTRGDHNLLRAKGQMSLALSLAEQRGTVETLLHRLTS